MPKVIDHETYKEELLLKCYDVFARRGYHGITLRKLAGELGISTGSLYHYFPTKQSILNELFAFLTKQDVDSYKEILDPAAGFPKMLEVIFAFIEERETYFQDLLLLTIEYFRHDSSNDTVATLNAAMANYRRVVVDSLKLPPSLSSMIILFLNGLVYHRLLYPGEVDFREQCAAFSEMILLYCEKHDLVI